MTQENVLVESLKRLYESKQIDLSKVEDIFLKGTITKEQFKYITGLDYSN